MASTFPDTPSDDLQAFHSQWLRTRTVLKGSQAVKNKGEMFLPRVSGQTDIDYQHYKTGVCFLPMAGSVLTSYLGLMFRKDPVLEDSETLTNVKEVITRTGLSLGALSKWTTSEILQTNWAGLLVDQDAPQKGLSLADQRAAGVRPFIAPYTAENILEVEFGVVRGERKPVYVRLKDSATQVRILRLVNGIYEVEKIIKTADDVLSVTETPRIAGKPLDAIPFVLVTLEPCDTPMKAPIEDVIELNCDHFAATGMHRLATLYSATPIRVITGFIPEQQEIVEKVDGTEVKRMVKVEPEFDTNPNSIWIFGDKDTKAFNLEFSGQSIKDLRQVIVDMEDKVAELSGGFWTREKASVEAPETHRLRLSTQNAKVAMMANAISERIKEALVWMQRWLGVEGELRFQIETDYLPLPMNSGDLTAHITANEKGKMSDESLFLAMRDRQVFNEALSWEEELLRREADIARSDARAQEQSALGLTPAPVVVEETDQPEE